MKKAVLLIALLLIVTAVSSCDVIKSGLSGLQDQTSGSWDTEKWRKNFANGIERRKEYKMSEAGEHEDGDLTYSIGDEDDAQAAGFAVLLKDGSNAVEYRLDAGTVRSMSEEIAYPYMRLAFDSAGLGSDVFFAARNELYINHFEMKNNETGSYASGGLKFTTFYTGMLFVLRIEPDAAEEPSET